MEDVQLVSCTAPLHTHTHTNDSKKKKKKKKHGHEGDDGHGYINANQQCQACCSIPVKHVAQKIPMRRRWRSELCHEKMEDNTSTINDDEGEEASAAACVYGNDIFILVHGVRMRGDEKPACDQMHIVCASSIHPVAADGEEEEEDGSHERDTATMTTAAEAAAADGTVDEDDVVFMAWIDRHELLVVARRNGWMGSIALVPTTHDTATFPLEIEIEELGVIPAGIACASFGAGFSRHRRTKGRYMGPTGDADATSSCDIDYGVVVCRDGTLMAIDCETLAPVSEAFVGNDNDDDNDDTGANARCFEGQVRFRGDGKCFVTMLIAKRTGGNRTRADDETIDCRVWRIDADGQIMMESVADAIHNNNDNDTKSTNTTGVRTITDMPHESTIHMQRKSLSRGRPLPRLALAWQPKGAIWAIVEKQLPAETKQPFNRRQEHDAPTTTVGSQNGGDHAATAATSRRGLQVVFRERNGLIRSSIVLPDAVVDVASLSWNSASDVLALVCWTEIHEDTERGSTGEAAEDCTTSGSADTATRAPRPSHRRCSVYLYTRRNYHWYLKREFVCAPATRNIAFSKSNGEEEENKAVAPKMAWDVDDADKLWVFPAKICTSESRQQNVGAVCVSLLKLGWTTRVSASSVVHRGRTEHAQGVGSVALVTDGNKLMLTSFVDAAIPPPMCHVVIEANDSIVAADVAQRNCPMTTPSSATLSSMMSTNGNSGAPISVGALKDSADVVAAITNAGDLIVVRKESARSWEDVAADCESSSSPADDDRHFGDTGMPSEFFTIASMVPGHHRLVTPTNSPSGDPFVSLNARNVVCVSWMDYRHVAIALSGGIINIYDTGRLTGSATAMDARYCGQVDLQKVEGVREAHITRSILSMTSCRNLVSSRHDSSLHSAVVVQTTAGDLFLLRTTSVSRTSYDDTISTPEVCDANGQDDFTLCAIGAPLPSSCDALIACFIDTNGSTALVVAGLSSKSGAVYRIVDKRIAGNLNSSEMSASRKSAQIFFRDGVTSFQLHIGPNYDEFGDKDAWVVTTHTTDVMHLTGLRDFVLRDVGAETAKTAPTTTLPSSGILEELSDNLHGRMRVAMGGAGLLSTQRGDAGARAIELGSILVCSIPTTSGVIVQAPRGNIELFYPRGFLVNNIMASILAGEYFEACRVCRCHRIDFNIIVDCNWPNCLRNDVASALVLDLVETCGAGLPGSGKSPMELLCDLLNDLRPGSVFDADGVYSSVEPLRSISRDRDAEDGVEGGGVEERFQQLLLKPKCTAICQSIREALFACLDDDVVTSDACGRSKTKLLMDLMEAILLTFIKCDEKPDCEGALRFIHERTARKPSTNSSGQADVVDVEKVREFGIRRLLLILDHNTPAVCNAALATYDIELCCYTYYYSDRDPLEFLPELEDLKAYCTLERRLVIDERLQKYTNCVDWLIALLLGPARVTNDVPGNASAAPDTLPDEDEDEPARRIDNDQLETKLLEILKQAKLYRYASSLIRSRQKKKQDDAADASLLRLVSKAHGEFLYIENRFDDAAVCFAEAKEHGRCQECYQAQHNWRMCFYVATHFNGYDQRQLQQLARGLVADMLGAGERFEASQILLNVLKDVDAAVRVLSDASEWRECLQAVSTHARTDLLKTLVAPSAAMVASTILEDCREYSTRLEKYVRRLHEVMRIREEQDRLRELVGETAGAAFDDDDGASQMSQFSVYTTSSTVASSAMTNAASSTAASVRHSKKKKSKKKSNKIRVGSPEELQQLQSFIADDLSPNRIVEARKVGELLELLVLLQSSSDAAVVQKAYGQYCEQHQKATESAASTARWKLELLRS